MDIGRTHRDIETSGRTSGSFEKLTQAQNSLEDELVDFKVATTNITNRLLAIVVRGTDSAIKLLKVAEKFVPGMAAALKSIEGNSEPAMPPWTDFLNDVAKGYADRPKTKRRI